MSTTTRTGAGGVELFTHYWHVENPTAAVVLVHGIAEHGGRYQHVGRALSQAGFDTRVTDLRGFGASGGDRAFVRSFDAYLDDLEEDVSAAAELGVPVVLLGHSLGGLIAALYAESNRTAPHLLVLSAPALDAKLPRIQVMLAKTLVRLTPKLKISNPLRGEQLSHDPEVGTRYFADPLVYPKTSVALGVAMMKAMEQARDDLERITQPMLVIHGGEDTLVLPEFSEPLAALPGCRRVVFAGFRHESFNEDGGTRAITTVVDWVRSQLPAG